ncbi:MAG TPA: hypothetical protein VLA12_22130, partial [Planctomycetaceae bacterium]|nr:hypothetical protein [Planctomycetaceae bacterium]
MRHWILSTLVLTGVLAAGSLSAQEAPKQDAPKPVHTNKTRFRIPYRFDAQEMARLRAQEIRLYTSIDQGQRWQLAQTVPPNSSKFEFQATADGEYWFAVRTLDGNNQLHPDEKVFTPGLKVVVDTTQPILKMNLRQSEPGKAELSWSAIDRNLNLDQLTLEYTQPGAKEWQSIRILPQAVGQTSWSVPSGGIVAVRGTVKDQAGNSGTSQAQISIDPAQTVIPAPAQPDFRRPVASDSPMPADSNLAKVLPADEVDPAFAPEQAQPNPMPEAFQAANHPFVPRDMPVEPSVPEVADNPFASKSDSSIKSIPVGDRADARPTALRGQYEKQDLQEQFEPKGAVRIVNSTTFEIGYQLNNVGPSGVESVELFITNDNGNRWWRYGTDDDKQSPFSVEVPAEGIYGFVMRVHSGAGLASGSPQNGDDPEMSVIVDRTAPEAKLLSIQPGTGDKGAQVLIRW